MKHCKAIQMKKNQLLNVVLFFVFIIGFLNLNAQEKRKPILKIAPLNLIDPFGSQLLLGSEFMLNEKVGLEINVAAFIPLYEVFDPNEPKIKDQYGIKLKPEIRYYSKSRGLKKDGESDKKFSSKYVAYEVFFVGKQYDRGDTFIIYDENRENRETFFEYETIAGFEIGNNVKFGYQHISASGFTFETYFGIGFAFYNYEYIYEVQAYECCPLMHLIPERIGRGIRPNMTLGIKLGLAL